jgi:hypothetical protein
MRYWITPDGSYYEGENVASGSVEVTQRPDDTYDWGGVQWVLNQIRYDAKISQYIEDALDEYIDSVAAARGYARVGVTPSASCLGYAGFVNPYQAEAIAFGQWMASLWPVVFQIQADVRNNLRPVPTAAQVISELPVMVWPV